MLFSSLTFLYYFLPVTLFLYLIVPKCMKNGLLLIASLFFYAWGEPTYVLIMIVSIIVGYIAGRLIETFCHIGYSSYILAGAILIHLGCFVYFKYTDFILENVNRFVGTEFELLRIALPIGISFYTFQILSYEIDVYRGKVKAQKNLILLATYVTMFPQLIAGPIVRYEDIEHELEERQGLSLKAVLKGNEIAINNAAEGICRFTVGLGKKVLIANYLGELCEIVKESSQHSVCYFWLYAIAFTLHIYYDFSGYSDMAIGLGRLFGFHFLENFNYPYISKSVTEFWRRWHISLGQWFRDYVYIPLGGNRCNTVRWFLNIGIVWLLTGLWHGAQWNFALWGIYFAAFLVIEKILVKHLGNRIKEVLRGVRWLQHLYLLLVVLIGFVLFNASDLVEAGIYIGGMFGVGNYPWMTQECLYYGKSYLLTIIFAAIGATPVVRMTVEKLKNIFGKKLEIIRCIAILLIWILATACLVDGSFNPFLYFRF